ncbi:MAG: tRNA lysidine(34) synthetase TilS [Spirochaetia bacterium]
MKETGEPPAHGIEDAVRKALGAFGIGVGSRLLAAVSGGPDSTALVRALAALRQGTGFSLIACIVDHGIRPAGLVAAEADFVRRLCAALGLELLEKSVPPGECERRARAFHRSLEEEARDARHLLLQEAAREAGADAIALGHTQDDVIETLLMRILQGSDVHGLRGIPARRGPFLRPMLACTRRQVQEYLGALGQAWCEDPSNRNTRFLRSRIRRRLVPVLEAEFPGFRTGMVALSRKLALSGDLVRAQARRLRWARSGRGFSIPASTFLAAHPAVRAWSLLRLFDRFAPREGSRRLPWRFLAPVLSMNPPRHDGTILRGHGAFLSIRGEKLSWGPDIARECKKGYFIVVSEARGTEIREAGVHVTVTRGTNAPGEGRGGIVILAGKVRPPIVLRSKRKGDSIQLAGGATSVKELLIGMKVPASERERIPILSDRSGVLAVLGGALGYCTRARADIVAEDRAGGDRMVVHIETSMEEGREQQR